MIDHLNFTTWANCRNPSFGLATKAKKGCKVTGQEEVRELRQEEAKESHHILPGM
jgi:hypothetical protein